MIYLLVGAIVTEASITQGAFIREGRQMQDYKGKGGVYLTEAVYWIIYGTGLEGHLNLFQPPNGQKAILTTITDS